MAATQKVRDERAEMDETTPDGSGLGLRTHFGGGQTTGFGVSDERRTHCCKEEASQGNTRMPLAAVTAESSKQHCR